MTCDSRYGIRIDDHINPSNSNQDRNLECETVGLEVGGFQSLVDNALDKAMDGRVDDAVCGVKELRFSISST